MNVRTLPAPVDEAGSRLSVVAWPLAMAGLAVLFAGLLSRTLMAPLGHDEQMFFTAGMMFGHGDLYGDFGYNHLPNLPILMSAAAAIVPDRPFVAGRLLVFAGWLAAAGVLGWLAWRATASRWVAALAVLLLIANPLLTEQAGTLISNNFLPISFALGGLIAFLAAVDRATPSPLLVLLAGFLLSFAIGLKANYVLLIPPFAVAAVLVPPGIAWGHRLRIVTLPLVIGGIIGGVPTLAQLVADRAGFLAHVLGYHQGPHRVWAAAQPDALVMSMQKRLILAQSVWMSGATLLVAIICVAVIVQLARRRWRPRWPVLLVAALVAGGMVVAFIPVPSFPQYFAPPLPFALVLMILLLGELPQDERSALAPLLIAAALLAVIGAAPRLLGQLPGLATPSRWTGNEIHRVSRAISAAAAGRPVATLAPVHVVAAGGTIYPELAAGPFVYRVADLIPAADRRHYRLVSPATLPALLDADPPGAILVGLEGALDDGLRQYAAAREYRPVSLPRDADARLTLYVRR